MNVIQSFAMALKAISANKVRSFLTMLGVVIGVSAVITLVSLVQGLTDQIKAQYEMMGTNRINIDYWDYRKDFTREIYDFCLSRSDLFAGVTPNIATYSPVKFLKKSADTRINFGSDQYDICNNYQTEKGRMMSYNEVKSRARVAVLGSKTAETLFNFADPLGKTIKIQGEEFTVIGVFKAKTQWLDEMVLVPYTHQRLLMKSTRIDSFVATATSAKAATEAVTELKAFFRSRISQEWYYNVYNQQEYIDQSNESMAMLSLVLGGIAGISLLVGGIGIMNIMLVSVSERTREIGIRKAIGANRLAIVSQFLIEAATISAVGGVIGIGLGTLGSVLIGRAIFKSMVFPPLYIIVGAFLFSITLGIFFGFYPASRASKLNPIDALRRE